MSQYDRSVKPNTCLLSFMTRITDALAASCTTRSDWPAAHAGRGMTKPCATRGSAAVRGRAIDRVATFSAGFERKNGVEASKMRCSSWGLGNGIEESAVGRRSIWPDRSPCRVSQLAFHFIIRPPVPISGAFGVELPADFASTSSFAR